MRKLPKYRITAKDNEDKIIQRLHIRGDIACGMLAREMLTSFGVKDPRFNAIIGYKAI